MNRYTGYVSFDEGAGIEEIDVDAKDVQEARTKILKELKADYQPGGELIKIKEQFGWYL